MDSNKIIVNGMTCNHCKATVEENVGNIEGISHVEADINKNTVTFSGKDFNLDEMIKRIESLGYNYGGPVE